MVKLRKIDNKIDEAFHDKKFNKGLKSVGKYTKNKILPNVVSTAIPIASTALGAVATAYGGPMAGQATQSLSQNLMEQYIPKKYQSNNKYIGMFGDALSQGIGAMNGDVDPNAMMDLQNRFTSQVSKDLTPKQKSYNNMSYYPQMPIQEYRYERPEYNPDDPYQDLIQQYNNQMAMQQYYQQPTQQMQNQPLISSEVSRNQTSNEDNDALYRNATIGPGVDSITNATPPFQQMEGSMKGLLGAGIRKRPLTASDVQKISDKKMASYAKKMKTRTKNLYSEDIEGAINPSLQQYLGQTKKKDKQIEDEDFRAILKAIKKASNIKTKRDIRSRKTYAYDSPSDSD